MWHTCRTSACSKRLCAVSWVGLRTHLFLRASSLATTLVLAISKISEPCSLPTGLAEVARSSALPARHTYTRNEKKTQARVGAL